MDSQPNVLEMLAGLFAASFVGILMMYVGGQLFEWDATRSSPVWIGLLLYIAYGGMFGVLMSIFALLLWAILCWKRACVRWWVPSALNAIVLGGAFSISGNVNEAVFCAFVGLCSGLALWRVAVGEKLRFACRVEALLNRLEFGLSKCRGVPHIDQQLLVSVIVPVGNTC